MTIAKTRIIVITGAPGVGKSSVARELLSQLPDKSVWIDTDDLIRVKPWHVDLSLCELAALNLLACVDNFKHWKARIILVSGAIVPGGIFSCLNEYSADKGCQEWQFFGLQANSDTLRKRIESDLEHFDESEISERLSWLHFNELVAAIPGCKMIDTSNLTYIEVAKLILEIAELVDLIRD